MQSILNYLIFGVLFFSLISTPAPTHLEICDVILLMLSLLIGLISMSAIKNYYINKIECRLILAISFYVSYLCISTVLGLAHGISFITIARNIGPYVNFLPLLLIGFAPSSLLRPGHVAIMLILVGLLQAGYHFFLYFTTSIHSDTTRDILIGRITLIDPRTSLPLFLALAILPVSVFFNHGLVPNDKSFSLLSITMIIIGFFAGIVTLTRAIILSIFFGWIVFIGLYLYYQMNLQSNQIKPVIRKLSFYTICLAFILLIILNIPAVRILFSGIVARFYNTSTIVGVSDYSNGRLYDEWLPAFNTWKQTDFLGLLFGVGAGQPFLLATGETHTYTHNLCLYSLLYGGFYGLFACLWLYFSTFKVLIIRAFETQHTLYLGYASLLASMFFYVQLFAVYKLLAFNAMLILLMALALNRQTERSMII